MVGFFLVVMGIDQLELRAYRTLASTNRLKEGKRSNIIIKSPDWSFASFGGDAPREKQLQSSDLSTGIILGRSNSCITAIAIEVL